MIHHKSGVIYISLFVLAPLAILFAILGWNGASASSSIQATTPITAATQSVAITAPIGMPMTGTMPMPGMDHGAMHGNMPITDTMTTRGMNPGNMPAQQLSQPNMSQMMTMLVQMQDMITQMRNMLAPSQPTVHDMGGQVMPFDLSRTTHIFEMTDSGGVQQVVAKDPSDREQIALIQQHLQQEATRFRAGDYSDPLSLHAVDMPGVKDLMSGAAQMTIDYSALPNGAQIVFTAGDIHLITALHRWFGAQLSDHGADATYR